MAIHAIPDADITSPWLDLLNQEKSGSLRPPLPAVNWVDIFPDRSPGVELIIETREGALDTVLVDVEQMPDSFQLGVVNLLLAIRHETGIRNLRRIFHLGGLDYSFVDANGDEVLTLLSMPREGRQAMVWMLLHQLALLTSNFPDIEASTPILLSSKSA